MKLTSFTDYTLRVLLYLAAEPSRRATIAEIATTFDVSENHLTKVVHLLGKRGWIRTVRGKGGGLELAREPRDICIGHVVREAEGAVAPAECFANDGGQCAISSCCRLKWVLTDAVSAFYSVLDRCTLADISRNRAMLGSLLLIPPRDTAMNEPPETPAGGPYPYCGPPELQAAIETALRQVVDPEVALTIMDLARSTAS